MIFIIYIGGRIGMYISIIYSDVYDTNLTRPRLVAIPEDIGLDRVETSILGLLDQIGPHLHDKDTNETVAN